MAKLTTTDLTQLSTNETSAVTEINNNFAATETAMENTLSRDGTIPNTMSADIDLNSNDLLNVNNIGAVSLTLGSTTFTESGITISFQEEGTTVSTSATFNVVGSLATVSDVGGVATLTISDPNHDALTGFVANEHIDHTAVTLSGGEGITGGGDISANRSFDLDVNGLTVEATVDGANDVFLMYDASAGAHRKVLGNNLPGGGGSVEGTAVLSTGEVGGTKFLREDGDNTCSWQTVPGGGGSAIILDLGDDASNESVDLTEIATSNDTNSIFTEPSADKLLIDVSQNWPTADDVDINGKTADASPDGAADYVMTYDASATANKKVLLNNLPSGGGGGGALEYITTSTVSSGTELAIELDTSPFSLAAGEDLVGFIDEITVDTDDRWIVWEVATDGAATWLTSGYDRIVDNNNTTVVQASTGQGVLSHTSTNTKLGNAAGEFLSGKIEIINPVGTFKSVSFCDVMYYNALGTLNKGFYTCFVPNSTALTDFRITPESGNMDATIRWFKRKIT